MYHPEFQDNNQLTNLLYLELIIYKCCIFGCRVGNAHLLHLIRVVLPNPTFLVPSKRITAQVRIR